MFDFRDSSISAKGRIEFFRNNLAQKGPKMRQKLSGVEKEY